MISAAGTLTLRGGGRKNRLAAVLRHNSPNLHSKASTTKCHMLMIHRKKDSMPGKDRVKAWLCDLLAHRSIKEGINTKKPRSSGR